MSDLSADAIRSMPAGRAMDALVAERILGLRGPLCAGAIYYESERERWVCSVCGWAHLVEKNPHPMEPDAYSTDIAAAWRVVEHLSRGDWFVDICAGWMMEPGYEVQIELKHDHPDGRCETTCDPSVALAICRAALLASL